MGVGDVGKGGRGGIKTCKWVHCIFVIPECMIDKSLVTSMLHYGCESWTLLADAEKRIQAFETKCLRKLLCISYLEHETNDWVQSKINFLVGPQEPLLQLSRDENLLGSGMSHTTTASPKPSFRVS